MLDGSTQLLDYVDYSLYFLFGFVLCTVAYWLKVRWPRFTSVLILLAIVTPIFSFPVFYTVEAVPVLAEELFQIQVLIKLTLFLIGILIAGRMARKRIAKAEEAARVAEARKAEQLWVEQLKAEQRLREEVGAKTPFVGPLSHEPYGSR